MSCDDDCKPGEFKCQNDTIEVCTKEGWEKVIDCNVYGDNFICVDHAMDIEESIYCEEKLK
jgi:hypothetical protein